MEKGTDYACKEIYRCNSPRTNRSARVKSRRGWLSYRGGPLIKNVAIHAIYWGAIGPPRSSPSTANIDQFLTYIVQSPFMTQLTEYNVPAYPIGPGTFAESQIWTWLLQLRLPDAEIQAKVKSLRRHPRARSLLPPPKSARNRLLPSTTYIWSLLRRTFKSS